MAQPIAHVLLYIVAFAFAATVRIVAIVCSRFDWHGATKRQSHGESTTSLIVRGLVASLHKDKVGRLRAKYRHPFSAVHRTSLLGPPRLAGVRTY